MSVEINPDMSWVNLRDDCYASLDEIIECANEFGPIIKDCESEVMGKGLFAEKDYEEGQKVTCYSGEKVYGARASGDYYLKVNERWGIDAEFKFNIYHKGRWINENPIDPRDQNVELKRKGDHGDRLVFVTTRPVKKGEQFFWYYGVDYKRTWSMIFWAPYF